MIASPFFAARIKKLVEKKDKRGYRFCYDDEQRNKRVKCPPKAGAGGAAGGGEPGAAAPTKPPTVKAPKAPTVQAPKAPGGRQAAAPKAPKTPRQPKQKTAPATLEGARWALDQAKKQGGLSDKNMAGLVDYLGRMSMADLRKLRDETGGAKGGRSKADLVSRVRGMLNQQSPAAAQPKPAEQPKAEAKPAAGKDDLLPSEKAPRDGTLVRGRGSDPEVARRATPEAKKAALSAVEQVASGGGFGLAQDVWRKMPENLRSHPAFDRAIEALIDEGKIRVQRHDQPSFLTPAELNELPRLSNGEYVANIFPGENAGKSLGGYRAKDWVTMGGRACADGSGQHCGGTPVELDSSGEIRKGPAQFVGKKPSEIKKDRPEKTKPKHPTVRESPFQRVLNEGAQERAGERAIQDYEQRRTERERGQEQRRPDAGGGAADRGEAAAAGGQVEGEAGRPGDQAPGGQRPDAGQPAGAKAAQRVPADKGEVNRRLDRFERLFRSRGNHQVADWMGMIKNHVEQFGVEDALKSLGDDEGAAGREETQYEGAWEDLPQFCSDYLDRYGITPVYSAEDVDPNRRLVSSMSPSQGGPAGPRDPYLAGDYKPKDPTFKDKLVESQHLPGLESSEDINKIMGRSVTHLTDEVMRKMDEKYGEGKWIIKTYGEQAFAGNGIYFPQRAKQIMKNARDAVWQAGENLARYGFQLGRDPDTGKIVGLQHESGDLYQFGTPEYESTIHGDARHWAERAKAAAADEQGAQLPFEGKEFMAQPAFPVVGVSEEERAQGVTFKKGQEARTHIVTRNGKAELVPHTTWLKMQDLPVVFEDDETRAMAQAALDAINALPESEKQGQIYAPDIVKTTDGFRVVEANPANETGSSGYLGDNPFIVDSYVSHLTGRTPAHVKFIRGLLSKKTKGGKSMSIRRSPFLQARFKTVGPKRTRVEGEVRGKTVIVREVYIDSGHVKRTYSFEASDERSARNELEGALRYEQQKIEGKSLPGSAVKAGFTGTKKDRIGRTHCYREGSHVACGQKRSGPKKARGKKRPEDGMQPHQQHPYSSKPRVPHSPETHAPPPKGEIMVPPPCKDCLYDPDPHAPNPHTGVAEHPRVGVPAMSVPPPPKIIPRLPHLTHRERRAETRFADAYLDDPDGMVREYRRRQNHVVGGALEKLPDPEKVAAAAQRAGLKAKVGRKDDGSLDGTVTLLGDKARLDRFYELEKVQGSPLYEVGDAPNIFNTDDAKLLSPDYNPQGADEQHAKDAKAIYNLAVHQTANALAKRAFLTYLNDTVSQLPESKRQVLVSSGGVASGKGFSLAKADGTSNLARQVAAVWDAAGEQNAAENPWVLAECKKRGIKVAFAFIHADPHDTWENPKRGVVERAGKKGRMVDARVFADSYGIGAKNFQAFYERNKNDPDATFYFIDNATGGMPQRTDGMPPKALELHAEDIYDHTVRVIKTQAHRLPPAVVRGGTVGERVWGRPRRTGRKSLPDDNKGRGGFAMSTRRESTDAGPPREPDSLDEATARGWADGLIDQMVENLGQNRENPDAFDAARFDRDRQAKPIDIQSDKEAVDTKSLSVRPSPFLRGQLHKGLVEKKDKRGHRYCLDSETGKHVPCPDRGEAAEPKRAAKKQKDLYGDGIKPLERDKPAEQFLSDEDVDILGRLKGVIVGAAERESWDREGLTGWGKVQIDPSKLVDIFGELGMDKLIDGGWVRRSESYISMGEGRRSFKDVSYFLSVPTKEKQSLLVSGLRGFQMPQTKKDLQRLLDLFTSGSLGVDVTNQYLEYLGIPRESIESYRYDTSGLGKLLEEMLYRSYNPVPIWERIAQDEVLQQKVHRLANLRDEVNEHPEIKPLRDRIKELDKISHKLFDETSQINAKIWGVGLEGEHVEPAGEEEKAALQQRLDEIATILDTEIGVETTVLYTQVDKLRGSIEHETIKEILRVKNASPIYAAEFESSHTEREKEAVGEAARWLDILVARGPNGETMPGYKVIRDDKPGKSGWPRAYYRDDQNAINVHTAMHEVSTNIHEMGHGIEYKMPGAQSATQRFLKHRVKDEPLQKLTKVLPDHGYEEWEEGRKDDFEKAVGESRAWYVGKKYPEATEVVSMGLEELHRNARRFAENDPEFCAFILGILDGRARDVPIPEA